MNLKSILLTFLPFLLCLSLVCASASDETSKHSASAATVESHGGEHPDFFLPYYLYPWFHRLFPYFPITPPPLPPGGFHLPPWMKPHGPWPWVPPPIPAGKLPPWWSHFHPPHGRSAFPPFPAGKLPPWWSHFHPPHGRSAPPPFPAGKLPPWWSHIKPPQGPSVSPPLPAGSHLRPRIKPNRPWVPRAGKPLPWWSHFKPPQTQH